MRPLLSHDSVSAQTRLFIEGFSAPHANLAHFPACAEMCKDNPECENQIQKYKADIEKLQEQFNDCFQDFHDMQPRIALFTDPLFAAVSAQPSELQLDLCELQADPFFQAKCDERGVSFWRLLPEARFPHLRDFALSVASMFGSTYICESSFSTMKHIKRCDQRSKRETDSDDTLVSFDAHWHHKDWH